MAPTAPVRKRPTRLNITFTPEGHAALERLAETTGIAISQYVASLIHDSIPVIDATCNAIALAKKSPHQAADIMNSELVRALHMAAQAKLDLDDAVKEKKLRRRPRR
jgi:hypothetical protein